MRSNRTIKVFRSVEPGRLLVADDVLPIEGALALVTRNPAARLGLHPRKGALAVGADADLLIVGEDLTIDTVIAGGRVMLAGGKALVRGAFEQCDTADLAGP